MQGTHKVNSACVNIPKYCIKKGSCPDLERLSLLLFLHDSTCPHLIYHFSYPLFLSVYQHSSLTFMLPLFSSKPDLLDRLAQPGPRLYPPSSLGAKLTSIYRTRVQSGEVVKIWTEDIFIHSPSQNSVVAFWSICYYRMSQQRNSYRACP